MRLEHAGVARSGTRMGTVLSQSESVICCIWLLCPHFNVIQRVWTCHIEKQSAMAGVVNFTQLICNFIVHPAPSHLLWTLMAFKTGPPLHIWVSLHLSSAISPDYDSLSLLTDFRYTAVESVISPVSCSRTSQGICVGVALTGTDKSKQRSNQKEG